MPIISTATRRHRKVRGLYAGIYFVLLVGAVSMIYPFLLMLAGSTHSAVDRHEMAIVPSFWHDDAMLYRKHVEGLFNERPDAMNIAYHSQVPSFRDLQPPRESEVNRKLASAWETFLDESDIPDHACALGYIRAQASRTTPQYLREFKEHLAQTIGDDETVNHSLGKHFNGWNGVHVTEEDYLLRRNMPVKEPFTEALLAFKNTRPRGMRYYFSPEGYFRRILLQNRYGQDIADYNKAHGTKHSSYADVHLSRRLPTGSKAEKDDWLEFVRSTLNLLWLRADPASAGPFRELLKAKYGTIDALNRNYHTSHAGFDDIPPIERTPVGGIAMSDWQAFVIGWKDPDTGTTHILPADMIAVDSLDFQFRDYLKRKYTTIASVNEALGTSYGDFMAVVPPQRDAHYLAFLDMRSDLRWEFSTRNYKRVIDFMVFHGRGILNTVVYCVLAVLAALIVNPLGAYALSRYKLPSTYKILLFLMLTMAFPPMVTQIPSFLMLREMGLLNTFAALILPVMVNGYLIFLLKGFFDSLPRELYEAAALDGGGEWTLFWTVTMSLSKPILAVIALQAFTFAYSNFMFALLICQDERMWTLMVWLYQLQQQSGPAVVYASLIIAAAPTFLVFVFCQKVILRGIVVPTEK